MNVLVQSCGTENLTPFQKQQWAPEAELADIKTNKQTKRNVPTQFYSFNYMSYVTFNLYFSYISSTDWKETG